MLHAARRPGRNGRAWSRDTAPHAVRPPNGRLAIFLTDEERFVATNLSPEGAARALRDVGLKPRYAELRVSRALDDRPFSRDGSAGAGPFGTGLGRWCQCLADVPQRHGWAEAERAIQACCG
jgi:hypothetical protein